MEGKGKEWGRNEFWKEGKEKRGEKREKGRVTIEEADRGTAATRLGDPLIAQPTDSPRAPAMP